MKSVKSFQTSDNRLFTDKVAALTHEFNLEIRGIIQTNINLKGDNYTAAQLATAIVHNSSDFTKIIGKYRSQITTAVKGQGEIVDNKIWLSVTDG